MEQVVWWVQTLKRYISFALSTEVITEIQEIALFHTNASFFGFPDMVQKGGHVTPMTLPWICPVPISYSSMSREVISVKGMPVQTNQWQSMDSWPLINV